MENSEQSTSCIEPSSNTAVENTDERDAVESIPEKSLETPVEIPKLIDFKSKPKCLSKTNFDHFLKGCKWSPDGLCILTCSDDHSLSAFDLPPNENEFKDDLKAAFSVKEGENVYDYQWYPLMNSSQPETCCFATTSQHQPIHLYDAFDGHIRASYRCFDHLDEMVAARSLCFSPSGDRLIAGLKNQVRIFDVGIPGRDCQTVKTFTKKEGGLGGIISAIAVRITFCLFDLNFDLIVQNQLLKLFIYDFQFNPSMESVFALATYSKSTAVYLDPRAQLLCVLEGQKGGITQIKFTPDGTKLLAGKSFLNISDK